MEPAIANRLKPTTLNRDEIADTYKWDLRPIFSDWQAWEAVVSDLDLRIEEFGRLRGTIAGGPESLLGAFRLADDIGQLASRVRAYAFLTHDQDQRDNTVNARRQRVEILFARWAEASAWFRPEVLTVSLARIEDWTCATPDLGVYRFAIEDLFRQQEHVLDAPGERLMSLSSRVASAPDEAYSALSTADVKFPTITLADGSQTVVSYGQYRSILATNRRQDDRAAAFKALHETFAATLNTYASLYDGVLQRDWFVARARGYKTTLEAALHTDNVPTSVVENLIATTRAGVDPLRRYHKLRKRTLGLETYHLYDGAIPLIEFDRKYPYSDVLDWIVAAVAPLGPFYQDRIRTPLAGGWIDVYENLGKRSGAYSAGVYGVHPYMLLNYNDTLDAVFTLAHELGHTIHTMLSDEHQPYIYSNYTIFVAEVPSTLSEALLLDYLLARTSDPRERAVLLQHAIDEIAGTFYTQVLFADYELQAHRLVEGGQPITSEVLSDLYFTTLQAYYGDALEYDELARVTWARIPHFFHYPFYVYQYATCFASSGQLARQIMDGSPDARKEAVSRFLGLIKAGGNDYPMRQLQHAGIDLTRPEPVHAVVEGMSTLVARLEQELAALDRTSPPGRRAELEPGRRLE
jgi:oligoendopeptidase F